MKRLLLGTALCLFAAPLPAVAGDLALRGLDVSIVIGDRHHRHDPPPQVVVIRDDHRRGHRNDHRDHRKHRRDWQEHRRWRQEPAVIVIDRGPRHGCDSRPVVVIADGRRR